MGRLRPGQRLRCRANRTRRGLGDCGDKEIGHRTSPEPVGREFASYLTRTMEMMCFDVESTERSEGRDEAIPFVGVARRETDFEVGHGPACEPSRSGSSIRRRTDGARPIDAPASRATLATALIA